ncbi:MAG: hypothetical protein ACYS7M_11575 [Planctomycetota bacterium]|jgi:hypothetical protein
MSEYWGELVWVLGAGLIWTPMVCLMWRMITAIGQLSGQKLRAQDRERHDMHGLIERLIEKRDLPDIRAAQVHASERRGTSLRDDSTERLALELGSGGDRASSSLEETVPAAQAQDYDG